MTSRLLLRAAVLLLAGAWPAVAQNEGAPEFLNIAFVETAFRTVNKNDAVAAVTVWAEYLLNQRQMTNKGRVTLYPSPMDLAQALQRQEADIVSLSASHYLDICELTDLEPLFLATKRGLPADQYQLLVRKTGAISSLSDLRNHEVLTQTGGHMVLGREWFDTVVHEEGLANFAITFTETEKILGAVMPVYMGQKPACLVTRTGFEALAELNPQLARELAALRASENMATAVVCLRRGYTYRRTDVVEALRDLDQAPSGQQILMLLKYERLIPFDDQALESTRALHRKVAALVNESEARQP